MQPRYEAAGADLFFDSSRESIRRIRLAVSHENCLGASLRGAKPSNELVSVGVRGEAVCRAELSTIDVRVGEEQMIDRLIRQLKKGYRDLEITDACRRSKGPG